MHDESEQDGRDLFTGILLGSGPYAGLLKDITGNRYAAPLSIHDRRTDDFASAAADLHALATKLEREGKDEESATTKALAGLLTPRTSDDPTKHLDQRLLLDRIESADPGVYVAFGQRLRSGNPVEVRAALKDGAATVVRALESLQTEGYQGGVIGPDDLTWEFEFDTYIYVFLFLVITQIDFSPVVGENSTYAQDKLIGELAEALAKG